MRWPTACYTTSRDTIRSRAAARVAPNNMPLDFDVIIEADLAFRVEVGLRLARGDKCNISNATTSGPWCWLHQTAHPHQPCRQALACSRVAQATLLERCRRASGAL